jgi:hypothetical protein
MVALQNRHNKGVVCKIVQDKELRDVSASVGSFRLKGGRKTSKIIVRRSKEIICSVSRTKAKAFGAVPKMGDGLPVPACRSWLQTARCCCVSKGVVVNDRGKGVQKGR